MLSLRNAVVSLVASAALVLVLVGVTTRVFTTASAPLPDPAPSAVHPDIAASQPAPDIPAPPQAAPNVPASPPRSLPVSREPVAHPTGYHRVAVQRQPVPAAHQPVPVAPAQNPQPVSPPPSLALPVSHSRSRTVNTEPCFCDGTMRKVPTHWDPPQD